MSTDTYGCQAVLNVLVSTLVAALTLVVMTAILATRNGTLTLMAFGIAPALASANVVFARRFNVRTLECREQEAMCTTVVQRAMTR